MPRDPSGGAILAVCLNPTIQRTLVFERLEKDAVNRTADYRTDASGKGVNVARVLAQRGRKVIHLTQLGGPTRDWFLAMCAADGLELRWVESGSDLRFCTTVLDRSDGSATELVEEGRPVEAGTPGRVLEEFGRVLPACSTVVLSGTKAAGFPASMMPELARLAAAAGKRLVLDLKGADLLGCLPFRPAIAKPNLQELAMTFGVERPSGLSEDAMRELVARAGREWRDAHGTYLVVTRGASSTLFWDGAALREASVAPCAAINPIGSGDAFAAGLADALEDGAGLADAVAVGNRLGALNAGRLKPGSIL